MSDHTAGPWRIGDAGTTVFGPKTDNPSPVTIAKLKPAGGSHKANARLIAAAPELLAACEKIVESLAWEETRSGTTYNGYETLRTAIARAKGEVCSDR